MIESLYCSNGLDETRVKRAFRWVVTFRDFPAGSYQTVDGDSMMKHAITFFTKGRAEFYLDGVRRGDRIPGILSTEHEVVGEGGEFTIKYIENTSRVCIPIDMNRWELPKLKKHYLNKGESMEVDVGFKGLVCLGSVEISEKIITEEKTFSIKDTAKQCTALEDVWLLQFLN
jgi:hypothetical protein